MPACHLRVMRVLPRATRIRKSQSDRTRHIQLVWCEQPPPLLRLFAHDNLVGKLGQLGHLRWTFKYVLVMTVIHLCKAQLMLGM